MNNRYSIGFICEHTAGYFLVPKFCSIFADLFDKVIPIYFHSGREGSSMTHSCFKDYKMKIVGMYPRRPKVFSPDQNSIEVKINYGLIEAAKIAEDYNIALFAGVPLISNILELNFNLICKWFFLNPKNKEVGDVFFSINIKSSTVIHTFPPSTQIPIINETQVIHYTNSCTKEMNWQTAVEAIKSIRKQYRYSYYSYFGQYKPIFLILLNQNL